MLHLLHAVSSGNGNALNLISLTPVHILQQMRKDASIGPIQRGVRSYPFATSSWHGFSDISRDDPTTYLLVDPWEDVSPYSSGKARSCMQIMVHRPPSRKLSCSKPAGSRREFVSQSVDMTLSYPNGFLCLYIPSRFCPYTTKLTNLLSSHLRKTTSYKFGDCDQLASLHVFS